MEDQVWEEARKQRQTTTKASLPNTSEPSSEKAGTQSGTANPENESQHDRARLQQELITEMQRSTDISTFFLQLVAARVGIHVTDMKVLSLLSRLGPLNASQIADLSGLTSGAITFVLDRLEKLGYARRVRSARDRRVVLIEVNTEALASKFGTYFQRMADITIEATTQLSDSQLALIVNFTQTLNSLAESTVQELKNDNS